MAQSSIASDSSGATATRKSLLELLDNDSDVHLVFQPTNATAEFKLVPAHSQLLILWSPVLATAIRTARNSSSSGASASSTTEMIRISMPDTDKEDWLLAMEFMYPVTPAAQVSWDNLETLLKIGDKFSLSALLQRIGQFISSNTHQLSLMASSERSVWKWIFLVDKYGMFATVKDIMDSQNVHELIGVCPMDELHLLCGGSLQHLVKTMAGRLQPRPAQPVVSCGSGLGMARAALACRGRRGGRGRGGRVVSEVGPRVNVDSIDDGTYQVSNDVAYVASPW